MGRGVAAVVWLFVVFGCVHSLKLSPCKGGTYEQSWQYTSYLLDEISVSYCDSRTDCFCLDCGECTEGVVPSTLSCKPSIPDKPQRWVLTGSVIESSGSRHYCLSTVGDAEGASLIMMECRVDDFLQQWYYDSASSFIVHNATGLCLDATPETASCFTTPFSSYPYCSPSVDPTVRAQDLVSRLTLEEKCLNMWSRAGGAPGIPRLGVPFLRYSEALHGVCTDCGATYNGNTGCPTSFPHALALGATFNRTLWTTIGEMISTEARALYNQDIAGLLLWAPDINLFRDPRWGRGQEVPGEDPYLTSEYATYWITAMQNTTAPDPVNGLYLKSVPTAKHYADYDLDSWLIYDRSSYNALVSEDDQYNYYFPPFQAAIQRANLRSIMCAYNAVNGVPSCANNEFMNEVARGEWGFEGFFVSDCNAVSEIFSSHHYTHNYDETAAAAVLSGCDAACDKFFGEHLPKAVRDGAVPESALDAAFVRVWTQVFTLGELDTPSLVPWSTYGPEQVDSPEHRQVALEASQQSIVLLKNDNILPLSKTTRVALIGPHFNATQDMLSIYRGTNTLVEDHSPEKAIKSLIGNANVVGTAMGCQLSGDDTSGFAEAVSVASAAEVALVFVGLHPGQGGGDAREDEGHDRLDISLPGQQLPLIQAVFGTGTPTVVVLIHGGQLAVEWLIENVPAIVDAFYPGELGGDAIASVLFGDVSPSGRLPYTVYDADFVNRRKMTDQSIKDNGGITYLYYQSTPLYEFGFGLSYTTFDYQLLSSSVSKFSTEDLEAQLERDHSVVTNYQVKVTNTGPVASDVSVLGFITGNGTTVPFRKLFGFDRVSMLQPGASTIVTIPLYTESLAISKQTTNGRKLSIPCDMERIIEIGSPKPATSSLLLYC
ncbi:glycoside hydrolase family 3 protein [Pelomyxa schiedti]|nr:glycoside hydrolase family 3 protein [Pelomyxa schiedti]